MPQLRRPDHRTGDRQAAASETDHYAYRQNTDPDPRQVLPGPAVDTRALTSDEEDELIEVVAIGYRNTTAQAFRLRALFITCEAFRNKVLRADETYRRRRTLVDFAHANCLRHCLISLPDRPELRNVVPNDDLLNAYNYFVWTPPQLTAETTQAQMNSVYMLMLQLGSMGLFTNQNGQPTRDEGAIEITSTSRGAFLAHLLRDHRVSILNRRARDAPVMSGGGMSRDDTATDRLESIIDGMPRQVLSELPNSRVRNFPRHRRR